MSPKTCLFVTALLVPACPGPATQGSTSTDDTTDTSSSSGDPPATSEPTTTESVMTSDPVTDTSEPPPGCGDGQQNGDESDVDCGGSCGACDGGAACGGDDDCKSSKCEANVCFPLLASCLALHEALPELPSGTYPLDPDGDGTGLEFNCDMNPESPGWTEVFSPAVQGAWDPVKEGACGDLGEMYGPYGMGEVLTLDTTAAAVPHTELRVVAEAVVMDSWDAFNDEKIFIKLDDVDIFTQLCDSEAAFSCNQEADVCGNADYSDGVVAISTDPAAHDGDAIALSFTSNLDEAIEEESWGVRAVSVFVK
ncbi:fibrinogen-like YCDxxxxGGGW domain-containing protein [Nannocystis sp. SCPEA4]|uniref:fibrinogen-like YCDxxxxGGGW domain-containing protein n=1 Tax=Nannocystis sp. SCPEA4 TaxID=2996787 RepID=UPI00226D9B12|nr:fibrinogen-like YCDxxxxGGGW domain-containing protein [Nannocystis sp. SCPEA4]MCY1056742.1 fibrinogen-like YCDxxxxGGGW domain-containing protein [Nannocystis sp. SCPEA4]